MKIKNARIISNFIIIFMFIIMIGYMGFSNNQYVFSYQNEDVIYNGNKNSNKISLMINVYWGTEYLSDMLEIFNRYDVKTTFFVGGQWVEKEPEMLNKIIKNGHEIGNHGYFHKDQEHLDYNDNLSEIKINHQLVFENTGYDMKLFAPPSGSFNKSTIKACKDMGYSVIMWSKDTIDWRDKDTNLIFKRATNVVAGDLILAHPTECTLKALPLILEYYKINNLNACTVTECIK